MDTHKQRSQRHRNEKELPQHCEALWLRLPKPGQRCAITGLSRATLNELILGPDAPVRSAVIRKRGNIRGIRLISRSSLTDYIESNVDLKAKSNGGAAE